MADIQQPNPTPPAQVNPAAEKIHIRVRNRTRVLFDGDAKSITSKNDTGVFDVLPEHSNFISLITSPLTIRTLDGQKQEITFNNGIIKVKDNSARCYIDLLSKEANTPK
jgi:F0F1-type ATP synthase epsilon subunit